MYWYSVFFSIPILLLWYSMILVDVFHFTLKYYFFFRFISIFSPFSCSMSTLSCLNDRLDHPLLISFNPMPSFVLTAVNMRKIAFLGISLCLLCGSVIAQYLSSWSSDHLTLSSLRVHYSSVYLSSWSFDEVPHCLRYFLHSLSFHLVRISTFGW